MNRPHYYVLDEKGDAVPASSLLDIDLASPKRIVAQDELGSVLVSTVFLCIDHGVLRDGPPVLWETMIFGGPLDQSQWRYTSREAALKGHHEAVELVRRLATCLAGES